MFPRFIGLQRIPLRILSAPRLGAVQTRTMAGGPAHDPWATNQAPEDAMSRWGTMEFETRMSDSGKIRITNRGLVIPEGKFENGIAKLNKRWNMWLAVAVACWVITSYFAITKYDLLPTGYFPLAVCKEADAFDSHLNYPDVDSNRYYQHYDDILPEVDDEDEEDDDE